MKQKQNMSPHLNTVIDVHIFLISFQTIVLAGAIQAFGVLEVFSHIYVCMQLYDPCSMGRVYCPKDGYLALQCVVYLQCVVGLKCVVGLQCVVGL